MSRATAPGNQDVKVTPAVRAVELATVTVKTFCPERLIEPVGRIRGLSEEQHRGNALTQKLTRHIAEQEPTEALVLNALQRVDLIQLPGKARHSAIVRYSLRERYQLAVGILDDEAKPAAVGNRKRLPPLSLS
jgi:hypothetical protein